ncbi:putative polyketide synthase [Colletotrichum zoysiae]|uniref:Polyketide synthase n=1 Tax=Colletotrichum zoysiae TaxID=1216348 RepID=A0AAD9HA82_9PEZI|nr:putative polyketide synthase [Colletotrichum zoysiae]
MGSIFNDIHDANGTSGHDAVQHDNANGFQVDATTIRADCKNGQLRNSEASASMGSVTYVQEPVAIVSMACRLPDKSHSPWEFWRFLQEGKIALNTPPNTRYSLNTHYDGSLKPQTMASPGGMFLQDVDLRDIDAQFFKLSGIEAVSMDPQQRQLLEVVYEGLENAGVTLEQLDGQPVGCFVSSFACDFADVQGRDPENRAPTTVVGVGRAMLSNRLSHFLNIKGPSMTIDTACSGALIGLDLAMRYLGTREITGAIVAGANLYYSPEHVMDHYMGANGAASLSGRCHTFDSKADGYIKAEAVNMVYLKRLDDAIHDGDPIRAVIRGTATNSDGWTAGIASPNPTAQVAAMRQAYKNAGIKDLSQTSYVEFHGTGTRAGDSIEADAVASVFSQHQKPDKPLRIGSVKSNIGHSEPAAGLSGLLKTILCLEKGIIPGNPTFLDPSPKIDFEKLRLWTSRKATRWPTVPFRRASVNSFGYGGSNAHVIVDEAKGINRGHVSSYLAEDDDDDDFSDPSADDASPRPYLLVFSANSEKSLEDHATAMDKHLSNPAVAVKLRDLAYTLSERRSRHYHRGFLLADNVDGLDLPSIVHGHVGDQTPQIAYVFTGQGAQWPQMGQSLLKTFPMAARIIRYLDDVLQNSYDPPSWRLWDELSQPRSAEHMRLPEISQPLVTALQLAIHAIFQASGVTPSAVVGHSSGEIAAAVAAGHLSSEQAIQIAYYRGKATAAGRHDIELGMMAAGVGKEAIAPFLEGTSIQVACVNSPQGVTLSGVKSELLEIEKKMKEAGHFARLLLVDAAYHSKHMTQVASQYHELLMNHVRWTKPTSRAGGQATMFSSTTGKVVRGDLGPEYWVRNMVSPVLFNSAVQDLLTAEDVGTISCLLELGPSNALAGPVNQIKKAVRLNTVEVLSAWKRGTEAVSTMLETVGRLFNMGFPIRLKSFNEDNETEHPRFISDLPNYKWDHSIKYWHESEASTDWRFRKFLHHDLLGSKILGTPWTRPIWKNVLKLKNVSWLCDHVLGDNVIFPGAGYIAMAIEAIYQKSKAVGKLPESTLVNDITYRLRDVTFPRVLTLEQDVGSKILFSLEPRSSSKESWHEFSISSIAKDGSGSTEEHCRGLINIDGHATPEPLKDEDVGPLKYAVPGDVWYNMMRDVGYNFGPAFKTCELVEAKADSRHSRAKIRISPPDNKYPQSRYAMHPAAIDGCLQIATVSLNRGHRSDIDTLMPPRLMDDLIIYPQPDGLSHSIVASEAMWSGVGRPDDNKRFVSDIRAHSETGDMLFHLRGFGYHAINASVSRAHTFTQVVWDKDFEFLAPEQIKAVLRAALEENDGDSSAIQLARILELVAHKRPSARFLEASLDSDTSACASMWLEKLRELAGPIARGCSYCLSTPTQDTSLKARELYAEDQAVDHVVQDKDTLFSDIDLEDDKRFDVIILKVSRMVSGIEDTLKRATRSLARNGFLILMEMFNSTNQDGSNGDEVVFGHDLHVDGVIAIPGVATDGPQSIRYLGSLETPASASETEDRTVHLVQMQSPPESVQAAKECLAGLGWNVVDHAQTMDSVPRESTVLVLDEMFTPVVADLSDDQFLALRGIIERDCRLLWVTTGSQMNVTRPELGLFFGVARSLLAEYPKNRILCLDVESDSAPTTAAATISTALKHLRSAHDLAREDSEFVERGGMYHISRVIGDDHINEAERASQGGGAERRHEIIRGHPSIIKLISERPGTLDTLTYAEVDETPPILDNQVEVEVHAAGMNFKDMANAMGFVPANEHLFGLECAGVITQIGRDVTNVKPGDRVFMLRRDGGCFANRVRNVWQSVHVIPDWMSYEDATTLGSAPHTAVYGLIFMAGLQKGQSVLIHSASGGVGLAAIALCKYIGAEMYVTVGSEAKREFLEQNYGIPRSRMFSSRSTAFAAELMRATNGRGVDVCLNSLTGDMLHESWRCIAEKGTLIEIGKKDMLDRNSLSMEPFDRNCSYRGLDMSRKSITDDMTKEIGDYLMELVRQGHFAPLHICKVFPFQETAEAFRYIQRGKHIGKVVISFEESGRLKVPYRPAATQLKLRSDRSYFIAGGFKGLNGSLAVFLARNGAKNIVAMARSAPDDERTRKIIWDCNSLGCSVEFTQGDIGDISNVRRAFSDASLPVAGVIQGAMVLRDRMFGTMTAQEFREPIAPKYNGTWNLHKVSLEQKQPLDFFVLLSSISGLVGQLGQANYAAGNTFLDSFAAYRLRQGLPACSINLGPVGDVGYLKDKDMLGRIFESRGWQPINEPLLHRIVSTAILQETHRLNPNPAYAGQLVTALEPGNPPFDPYHRFSALRAAAGTTGASGGQGAGSSSSSQATRLAMLKNASKGGGGTGDDNNMHETLVAAATELVNAVLMRSLGTGEPLDPTRPLSIYGVDSLVAVELRNWARAELDVEFSTLDIIGARTLHMLCESIVKKLVGTKKN